MHGIFLTHFKKYVESLIGGTTAWDNLLKEEKIPKKIYMPISEYPDEEMFMLLDAIEKKTQTPASVILEDFGTYLVPSLFKMYKEMIKPQWKTLDLIENTEQTIHKVVRIKNPGAHPPKLECKRMSPHEIFFTYRSQRKMCALAKGIMLGIASHYHERIKIAEKSCMNEGDSVCEMSVLLEPSAYAKRTGDRG